MCSKIPYCPGYSYCHNLHDIDIDITVTKVTICGNCTVLDMYRSPNIPIRQLCQVLDNRREEEEFLSRQYFNKQGNGKQTFCDRNGFLN